MARRDRRKGRSLSKLSVGRAKAGNLVPVGRNEVQERRALAVEDLPSQLVEGWKIGDCGKVGPDDRAAPVDIERHEAHVRMSQAKADDGPPHGAVPWFALGIVLDWPLVPFRWRV